MIDKKIAFTVCTANHLAFAKTTLDSFKQFNKAYQTVIILIDSIKSRFDKFFFAPHELVEIEDLEITIFTELLEKFSFFELACALKPILAEYLMKIHQPKFLVYLDTDLLFFNSLAELELEMATKSFGVCPHVLSPMPDDSYLPSEVNLNNSGIYNAGFFIVNNCSQSLMLLKWWTARVFDYGFVNFNEGMFVDQIWLNHITIYFKDVNVLRAIGYNVAYWNLQERSIELMQDDSYIVNGFSKSAKLVFFHASGFNVYKQNAISRHQNRFDLKDLPVLQSILEDYAKQVLSNNHVFYSTLVNKVKIVNLGRRRKILQTINRVISFSGYKLNKL